MSDRRVVRRAAGRVRARARRAVRDAYYAAGYGRTFPGRDRIEARVRAWEAGRGDVPKDKASWEDQYASGGWDYLSGLGEVAHYAVIVGYARHLRPQGSVLDVGCGSGVLHERFRDVGYAHYTGVDISETAVAGLAAQGLPDTDFVAADADAFRPDRVYDVVVLNESLTYFPDPAATFARYLGFVAEGGVAIVSCHVQSARARAILRRLEAAHDVLDATDVRQGANAWRIAVFQP